MPPVSSVPCRGDVPSAGAGASAAVAAVAPDAPAPSSAHGATAAGAGGFPQRPRQPRRPRRRPAAEPAPSGVSATASVPPAPGEETRFAHFAGRRFAGFPGEVAQHGGAGEHRRRVHGERVGGVGADDAVDGEPARGLEAAHRRFGFGPVHAVDRDPERALQQAHLAAFAAGAQHDLVRGRRDRVELGRCRPRGGDAAAGVEQRRGRPGGERHQGAQREPLGARGGGHEAQLRGAPAGAGAPEGEIPRLAFGQVARGFAAGVDQRGEGYDPPTDTRASFELPPRLAVRAASRRRRARERASEASQGSRVARSRRADPGIGRSTSFRRCGGAYGVSCRARAVRYAANAAIRPRGPCGPHWFPRSPFPWEGGFGTNGGHRIRFDRNLHRMGRAASDVADGPARRRSKRRAPRRAPAVWVLRWMFRDRPRGALRAPCAWGAGLPARDRRVRRPPRIGLNAPRRAPEVPARRERDHGGAAGVDLHRQGAGAAVHRGQRAGGGPGAVGGHRAGRRGGCPWLRRARGP